MVGSGKQEGSRVNLGAQTLLKVLEKKPYYAHRFLGQVQALYGLVSTEGMPDITASLYLTALFARIPEDIQQRVGAIASAAVVNKVEGCPSPSELRSILGDAVLAAQGLSYAALIERAKLFLACPPTDQNIANRWPERVIYTTIRRVGRERFGSASPEDWQREVAETMFGDSESLTAYQVQVRRQITPVKRDFHSLIKT
jgi:hypothetical protein